MEEAQEGYFVPPLQTAISLWFLALPLNWDFYSLMSKGICSLLTEKSPSLLVTGRISLLTSWSTQILSCRGVLQFGNHIHASLFVYSTYMLRLWRVYNYFENSRNAFNEKWKRLKECLVGNILLSPNGVTHSGQTLVLKNSLHMWRCEYNIFSLFMVHDSHLPSVFLGSPQLVTVKTVYSKIMKYCF